ncbi:MAG: hypothetical protein AAGI45_07035 [Cyanobacteria bacterium P01_H01_bin.26]
MADCVGDPVPHQRQENSREFYTDSDPAYWTGDLSVSGSSSLWWYHSALAVGATVVCSAGAIMQYTEAGLWSQQETVTPNPAHTKQSAQTEAASQVSTPPVVNSQERPVFSSSAPDSKTCKDGTCKGIAFIERRLPEIQGEIRELRTEMQQFQKRHTAQNLQTHRSILVYRSTDVARKQAELAVRSQQLDQQLSSLTSALALQPAEVSQIASLLQTDTAYQGLLQQLQALESDIAIEYSNPDLNSERFNTLYAEYSQTANELRQIAQAVLADYVAAVSLESPDPLWQEDSYHALLQELMDLSHLRQMLAVEENTLAQMDSHLTVRRTELASLLKQYAVMQRQLEGQNQVLQQYIAKREALQDELT